MGVKSVDFWVFLRFRLKQRSCLAGTFGTVGWECLGLAFSNGTPVNRLSLNRLLGFKKTGVTSLHLAAVTLSTSNPEKSL